MISERTPNVAARLTEAARRRPDAPRAGLGRRRAVLARARRDARPAWRGGSRAGRGRGRRRRAAPAQRVGLRRRAAGRASRSGPPWRRSTRCSPATSASASSPTWARRRRGGRRARGGSRRPDGGRGPQRARAHPLHVGQHRATQGHAPLPRRTRRSPTNRGPVRSWRSSPTIACWPRCRSPTPSGSTAPCWRRCWPASRWCCVERFSPRTSLGAIARHRVTVLPGVATMFRAPARSPALPGADVSSLRLARVRRGALPVGRSPRSGGARTGVRIVRGYGMTELFRPHLLSGRRAHRPSGLRSAARCPASSSAWWTTTVARSGRRRRRAADPHAGGDGRLPRRARGDARGAARAAGSSTGDLATITADGFVTHRGAQARAHPARRLLGLARRGRGGAARSPGRRRGRRGRRARTPSWARRSPPSWRCGREPRPTPEELIACCRERLAGFKYPRRVTIVAELPKSATGKILKGKLRG